MSETPHILLIDDEAGVLRALELMLSVVLKYQVTSFTDPREALHALETNDFTPTSPDWIVCDLRMPEIDGLGVLENRNKLHPNLPFILISGHATEDDRAKALSSGAHAVLRKPFSPDELKEIITSYQNTELKNNIVG